MAAHELAIWYEMFRNVCSRRVYHICTMKTKDGRMVASKAPRKMRQMSRPTKFLAADVQMVTMPQEIMLNLESHLCLATAERRLT